MDKAIKKSRPHGNGNGIQALNRANNFFQLRLYRSISVDATPVALTGRFNTMGFVEMGIVLNHVELQPAQKMILMALADRADAEGVCWPSIGEIAHRTCQSERTVLRHIAALKDLGLLTSQQRRYRTAKGDTRQDSNVYHLNLTGMLAGNFDSHPKREKTSSGPGCQSVTQENAPVENLQVNPG